ncbi:MAG: hypothetical protein AAB676_01305, partial [Verrucomicrobiota bacterium]
TETLLVWGSTVTGDIADQADRSVYTFTGTVAQRLYYDALDADFDSISVQLYSPSGALVHLNQNADYDAGPFTLTEAGDYKLVMSGSGATLGDFRFRLLDVASMPVLTFGTPVDGELTSRREVDLYRFTGTAGQRITLTRANTSGTEEQWRLISPQNSTLLSVGIYLDLGQTVLPVSGEFVVLVDSSSGSAAPFTYQISMTDQTEAPITATGFGVVNSGTINAGGTDSFTFNASAGTVIYFDSQDLSTTSLEAQLINPESSQVFLVGAHGDSGVYSLAKAGSYALNIRSAGGTGSGTYKFRLLNLSATTLLVLNSVVNVNLDAYQTEVYPIVASAGKRLFYDALDGDFDNVGVTLHTVLSGIIILNRNADSDSSPFTLGVPGEYYLVVENNSGATDHSFRVVDVLAQPVLPVDTVVTETLTPGFFASIYRFTGAASSRLFFDSQGSNSGANWNFYGPNNEALGSANVIYDFDVTLAPAGVHTLVVSGASPTPVPVTFQVVTAPTVTTPLTLGAAVNGTIAEPGEQHHFTFTGIPGQRLYYDAHDGDFDQINVRLYAPSGGNVHINQNSDSDWGPFTLAEAGTYTLIISGSGSWTGDYSFRMLNVADQTALAFDSLISASLNPGRSTRLYPFTGTVGQRLYFDGQGSDSEGDWV